MSLIIVTTIFENASLKIFIPSIFTFDFITVVIANCITAEDKTADSVQNNSFKISLTFNAITPIILIIIAIIYFAITLSLTKLFSRMERRLNNVRS